MKTAICFSGIPRGNVTSCVEKYKKVFPNADPFYFTWTEYKTEMESILNSSVDHVEEPEIDYCAFLESPTFPNKDGSESTIGPNVITNNPNRMKRFRDNWEYAHFKALRTKQLIGHALHLEKIPLEYDMIIRARYDIEISLKCDFDRYVENSYEKKRAIGFSFGVNGIGGNWETIKHLDGNYQDEGRKYLEDFMIFHPREMYDSEWVKKLYKSKQLYPSEIGWYQILSYPFGTNHLCCGGGVRLAYR